ncbi:overproduction-induced pheromone-resistant [Lithohypha guttulata]|uniref:Overproduction-induced pheromone-resistant n=1 Tax=Lithohypha guttulata TaxID=1690604 RepID=A0AAN7SVH2_9EURO|nr:overproduction-induced pheromone-resistant [Lithohypha guttulata]
MKLNELPGQVTESKPSTPVGPIVGGVLGAVAVIAVGVFCLWVFCVKPRRRKDTWDPPEKRDQSNLARDGSRTHSIASTVLTRASNVIQIAYIPGVTGRSPPVSPGVPPPMPTIAGTANSTPQPDTHFFMADDLRNSTWSDTSVDPRISLAPSLARASSGTTVYYENAVMPPIPAQHAMRAQANMVNVKQIGIPNTSTTVTPTRPSPLSGGGSKAININNSSIVARNVTARPIEVKKTASGNRVPTLGNLVKANSQRSATAVNTARTEPILDEKEVVFSPVTDIDDSPTSPLAPLRARQSDMSSGGMDASGTSALLPPDGPLGPQRPDSGGLTAMIEDAIKSASADTRRSPRPGAARNDSGPFSDIHELPSSGSP